MAKNICPKCKEVILGLGNEVIISCEKCNTVFKTVDDRTEIPSSFKRMGKDDEKIWQGG